MEWGVVKFFFKTMLGAVGSTLSASTTDTAGNFDVDFINDWLEAFSWRAGDTVDPVTITFDAGAGNTPAADYLGIRRHNTGTIGATIALQNSSDNFGSVINTIATVRPTDDLTILKEIRAIANGDFEVWQEGVAVAPTGWSLVGGGASVAREATLIKQGAYSAAVTRSGADCYIRFIPLNHSDFASKTITMGCWIRSSVPTSGRLTIFDGVAAASTTAHPGDSTFIWTTLTFTVDASPTLLELRCFVGDSDTTGYFDHAILKEGTVALPTDESDFVIVQSNAKRYWRLKIVDDDSASFTAAPSLAIAVWGEKVELDHVSFAFDPNAEEPDVNVNRGHGGIVTGIHTKSIDRVFTLGFLNKDETFYDKVDDWWQTHGQQQFFVGWNTDDHPEEVYLVYPESDFRNPFNPTGDNDKRSITIDFRGVKE